MHCNWESVFWRVKYAVSFVKQSAALIEQPLSSVVRLLQNSHHAVWKLWKKHWTVVLERVCLMSQQRYDISLFFLFLDKLYNQPVNKIKKWWELVVDESWGSRSIFPLFYGALQWISVVTPRVKYMALCFVVVLWWGNLWKWFCGRGWTVWLRDKGGSSCYIEAVSRDKSRNRLYWNFVSLGMWPF